jgi:hypothetical protein
MLPARPRLRASFFFEGDAIACDLTLMNERRGLVHRQKVPVLPGSGLEQFHAALLSLAASLMVGAVTPREPTDVPMSEEELQAERERRAELRELGWHPSVLRVLPGDPPQPIAPLLTLEELQAERTRRAAAQVAAAADAALPDTKPIVGEVVIENSEPPPTEPPPRLTPEEIDAERERRARGQTQPLPGGDVVIANSEQE